MAQELVSGNFEFGIRRNYWVRDKEGASSEVDLVYQFGNKVIPVGVESGTNSKLQSYTNSSTVPHMTLPCESGQDDILLTM